MNRSQCAALAAPLAVLSLLLAVSAGPAGAAARCDAIRKDPNVLVCEDFENPALNRPGALRSGHAWFDRFGPTTPGLECEGPNAPCGVDVVAAGQCNAAGESGG